MTYESDTAPWSVRCALDGVSYHSHSMGFVLTGLPLRQMLARPHLRLPPAMDVFTALLGSHGTLRNPRQVAIETRTLQLWGGLEALVDDLSNTALSAMLRGWLSDVPSGVDPGIYCDPRRFLAFDDTLALSAMGANQLREILDRYVVADILRRGLILGCPRCSNVDHHELTELGPTFQCRRCNQASDIVQSALARPSRGASLVLRTR